MSRRPFIVHLDPLIQSNFASREISDPRPAAAPGGLASAEEVFAECERCSELPDGLVGWKPHAGEVLAAVLRLLRLLEKEPHRLVELQARPSMKDRLRRLSTEKRELLCTYACRKNLTLALRKECSRFANTVRLAVEEGVVPEQAAAWLATKTQRDAMERKKAAKPSSKFSIRLARAAFPQLALEIANSKSPLRARVMETMEEAARRCEALLHDAMSSTETPTNNSTGATNA